MKTAGLQSEDHSLVLENCECVFKLGRSLPVEKGRQTFEFFADTPAEEYI